MKQKNLFGEYVEIAATDPRRVRRITFRLREDEYNALLGKVRSSMSEYIRKETVGV